MITPKQAYLRLSLILLIFFLLTLAHSLLLPLHEAPDEVAHYLYSRFIADTGRLPQNLQEREAAGYRSDWPALYHVLVAAAVDWSNSADPPYLKFVWESSRFDLARELLFTKRVANTEDEFFPFQGPVLTWHISRLLSIVFSMVTIVIAFFTTLEFSPKNYWPAVVSAAILAFVPTFIFVSSAMSDDTLTGLLLGLYFLVLVKIIKGSNRYSRYIWLGLLMGLAATTKYSNVILPLQVVGVVAYLAWRHQWGWLGWLKRVAVTALAAIVASGWWYFSLIYYFNEIDEYGIVIGSLKPIIAGGIDASQRYVAFLLTGGAIGIRDSPEFISEPFWQWAVQIYQSFWVRQIESYPLGAAAQILIGLVCVIAVIGLIQTWRCRPDKRFWITLFVTHLLLFLFFPFLRQFIQGNVSQTAQGRHVLFPVATVFPVLIIYGWQGWLLPKTQRRLALAIVGGLLCWSMAQLIRVIDYPILYLPIRTTAQAAADIPHRVDQSFGEKLTLLGHNLEIDPADNALKIKLYWHSLAYVDEDYQMTVGLVQQGQPVLSWTQYPVNGRYPTRIWESRETIRDDVWLPLTDLPPGDYQVQLQLHGSQGPLPAGQKDAIILDKITVGEKTTPPAPDILTPVVVKGREVITGLSLWQAERYRRISSALPEYRPRMQIPFVWQGQPASNERVQWLLVGPDGQAYPPTLLSDHFEYFMVGLDWPSGNYRLRAEIWRGDEVVASQEIGPLLTVINKKPRLLEAPPVTHQLDADFAGQIKLLGYDLPVRTLEQGQGVPVTLYWQGLRTMGTNFTVFAKLLDQQGQQVWGSIERFPADGYQTIYWLENEIVVDGFELPVDPGTPAGIYWLNVGLYEEVNGQALSLPLVVDGQPAGETSVTFGPVKIGDTPPAVMLKAAQANPQTEAMLDLGQPPVIRLIGYDLSHSSASLDLTLYWESLAQTPVDWSVFAHVQNDTGETVAQKDGPAGGGRYPTSLWDAGEIVSDNLAVPLDSLVGGHYSVVVGLYNIETGERLFIPNSPENALLLDQLEIER